ncbi:MAG: alpha/beta fold hydrolase [Rhodothermales bacterium]
MPAIQLDGTQLEYIEKGTGEPVVFVHGTLGDYRSWELQLNTFAETYRVISYSRRYHYPNHCNGDESDYSAALHADDLASFITGLGLKSAHIVGTSYGAYTSLLLAARHPDRVRALVLGDPPVFPLLEQDSEGRKMRHDFLASVWKPAGEMMRRGEIKEGVRIFVDGVVQEGAFDQFPPEVRSLILDNACEFKVETSSPDFWTPFRCEEARRIETPTLLLTGDQSLKWLRLIVEKLDRCLPNSTCVTLPETTHEVTSDNPEAFNAIVLDFLARHSA